MSHAAPLEMRRLARQIELPRGPAAGSHARRILREDLSGAMSDEALDDALMVVSELVNNAVVHGSGAVVLKTRLCAEGLRVEVIDEGTGNAAAIRDQGEGDGGGWGLRVVDALSTRWGAHEGTTHVWADLPIA